MNRIKYHDSFQRERTYLVEKYKCKRSEVRIVFNDAVQQDCIYVKGKWVGYADFDFDEEVEEFFNNHTKLP